MNQRTIALRYTSIPSFHINSKKKQKNIHKSCTITTGAHLCTSHESRRNHQGSARMVSSHKQPLLPLARCCTCVMKVGLAGIVLARVAN